MKIPTYIINLKHRTDRRAHVLNEFHRRDEFVTTIVEACYNEKGYLGLWETVRGVIQQEINTDSAYILICQDDHEFTDIYSRELLDNYIAKAQKNNADALLGGLSWFEDALQVNDKLYWTNRFTGLQFAIVFRKFFQVILEAEFGTYNAVDLRLSDLSENLFFIFPFISTQKEFGYSDVTIANQSEGIVRDLFISTTKNLQIMSEVTAFYKKLKNEELSISTQYDKLKIPTYVINLPERTERRLHIEKEFNNRPEFDIKFIEACKETVGALGLWKTIRKIIQTAILSDDDVIIICEDDHEFTKNYDKTFLLQNIITAYTQGVDYLNCGSAKFDVTVPVSKNRFWTDFCLSTQFIVLFKSFFQKILDAPFDNGTKADTLLSSLTCNKMLLYPAVSTQRDFGYSDATPMHNKDQELMRTMFKQSKQRFDRIYQKCIDFSIV